MTQKHTFQSIILKLQQFWDQRGYVIWQPYYTQVGAGTMNPATFLRVLGPEPWHVAYVEPSVRPDDARYGENPNRFQLHYQFQVIIKPDPGDPQELYLESLKAIGIDPRRHDIRFVEDNWAQPAISAWGLGWEVWLDGQEITQFTYFQQVGGVTLDPVAVELTYGLERILIALNNAGAIWNEPWAPGVSYGEVRRHDEYEHSKHYFETADVERVRQMFVMFEAEAQACIDQGLVLPAHDYVLKCSHTFNILDTRGAIGVTERQAFFHRMRELSRRVAEAYLEQRQAQEYPLLQEQKPTVKAQRSLPAVPDRALPFVLEIGVEELPPGDVTAALEQLQTRVPELLAELRLEHGNVSVLGTPRRLAIQIEALSPHQSDLEEIVKGPPAARAYDTDGNPTQAALGFARGKGVDVVDLQTREMDGGKYVAAIVRQAGRPTPEILAEQLPKWIAAIKFEKSMRWNQSGVAFSRPIRWLVALLGEYIIPFEYAGIESGRTTRGLRPYDSPTIEVPSAEMYATSLAAAEVMLDPKERQAEILTQIKAAAALAGGEVLIAPDLLDEVTHLVEKPTALLGDFDPRFLALPEAVLISTMKKHQRYFPVKRGDQLLPHFIAVRNGDREHLEIVQQGNEHVLGARFADANYFVRQDLEQPLAAYRPKLDNLIFQSKLGSMLDKANRIEKLVQPLIKALGLPADQATYARRGAHLCKADLVTQMVVEMTSLQGIIGAEYALRSGEAPEVAAALREHYQAVPQTLPGIAVALADRLDSLAGLFAAGLAPSGAKDPFGLRRAALGIVQPLIEHDIDLDLGVTLTQAAELQPIPVGPEIHSQVLDFITGRLRVLLTESGFHYDVVEAVLAAQGTNPAGAARAVRALENWVARSDWDQILPAYARCVRITRDQSERFGLDPATLVEPAERELFAALQTAQARPRQAGSVDDFLNAFLPMIPAVNRFFDDVLVMVEDQWIRQNRLGLLQQIVALADGVADLSHLEGF
ncbi:MAG: glycine--tRNA ligase subunit beta [Anaerolineales bacterium]|nr:glycine--tRNA ligase subunit beta [Anaerolineales bacterium]